MDSQSISLIITFLLLFSAALGGGFVAHRLKLPLIVGYIFGGFILGNLFPKILDTSFISNVSDVGVILLMFTVGLEFSFSRMRSVMKMVFWGALAEIILVALFSYSIGVILGLSPLPALFFSVAAALSSTAIVVKSLSERGELETVPGTALTGWLVIQDLTVVPIMIILPVLVSLFVGGTMSVSETFLQIGLGIGKSIVAIGAILFLGRVGIPKILGRIATLGVREVFVITTVGIVFISGVIFYALNLSAALGAFIAGLLIAETSQNHAIFAEIRPLRDLFVVVFFVSLGMSLPFASVLASWQFILLFTVLTLLTKSFISYGVARFLGFHRKTAFTVTIGLLSISEFAFILAKEGMTLNVLDQYHYASIVAIAFLSIIVGAPLFAKANHLYYDLNSLFMKKVPKHLPYKKEHQYPDTGLKLQDHVVICGYGRVGKYIGRALEMANIPFVVIEYNQYIVRHLRNKGIQVVYGDPAERDVLDYAQVDKARIVVVAIPDRHTQEMVIANVQTLNKTCKIICRTHHEEDQIALRMLGVSTIVQPEFEAALTITSKLLSTFGVPDEDISGKISRLKIEHGMG